LTIQLEGGSSHILASFGGATVMISNATRITNGGTNGVSLLVREPFVRLAGSVAFKELYWGGTGSNAITRTTGSDLVVEGQVSTRILLSDTYSLTSRLSAAGGFSQSPPILQYDETSSLYQTAFYSLLAVPIIYLAAVLHQKRQIHTPDRRGWNSENE
jgi:hypothetical protein